MNLLPHETALMGKWIETEERVCEDAVCTRIIHLTNGILDIVQDHPKASGWTRLFRDRADGRFWERSYPQGELQGGGPPTLRWISDDEVTREYGFQPAHMFDFDRWCLWADLQCQLPAVEQITMKFVRGQPSAKQGATVSFQSEWRLMQLGFWETGEADFYGIDPKTGCDIIGFSGEIVDDTSFQKVFCDCKAASV